MWVSDTNKELFRIIDKICAIQIRKMVMYMQFKYSLEGSGWAYGYIEVNSRRVDFNPSYLRDAFGDLVRGLVNLLNDEACVETFLWDEEPRGLKWKLALLDTNTMSLLITEYADTFRIDQQKGVIVIDTNYNFLEFIKAIVKEAEQLLLTHGIVGYQASWDAHEFPLSSYLQLKYYLEQHTKLDIQTVPKDEDGSGGYSKSNIKLELQYLTEFIHSMK